VLHAPLCRPTPRARHIVQQQLDPDIIAEVEQREKEAAAARAASVRERAASSDSVTAVGEVQLSGRASSDAVDVDLVLAMHDVADEAEIRSEADFMFEAVDTNSDGEISRGELGNYLGSAGYAAAQVDTIFDALDINSDGAISQQELRRGFALYEFSALRLAFGLAGARKRENDGAPCVVDDQRLANADELFESIDSDGNGKIDRIEFAEHLSKTGYSRETIARIFDVLDVNVTGTISRDELRRAFACYEYSALRLALGIKPASA